MPCQARANDACTIPGPISVEDAKVTHERVDEKTVDIERLAMDDVDLTMRGIREVGRCAAWLVAIDVVDDLNRAELVSGLDLHIDRAVEPASDELIFRSPERWTGKSTRSQDRRP